MKLRILKQLIRDVIIESCLKDEYWGIGGAGMIFVCNEDNTVFLQKRGSTVTGGAGQWAFPGGGIHPSEAEWEQHYETPIDMEFRLTSEDQIFYRTALEEVREEVGSVPKHTILNSYIFEDCGFIYKTFVANVTLATKEAWMPEISEEHAWEASDEAWFTKDEFYRKNLFFGFTSELIQMTSAAMG